MITDGVQEATERREDGTCSFHMLWEGSYMCKVAATVASGEGWQYPRTGRHMECYGTITSGCAGSAHYFLGLLNSKILSSSSP